MATQYKFPCPNCDAIFELSTSQAGQELTCPECKQNCEAPTLGKLRTLVPVNEVVAPIKRKSANNIGITIGLALAICAGITGGLLYNYSQKLMTDIDIEGDITAFESTVDEAPPEVIVAIYSTLDAEKGLGEWQEPLSVRYNKQGTILKYTAFGLFGIAGIGLIIFLKAIIAPGKS